MPQTPVRASARPWTIGTGYAGYQTAIIDADGRCIADVETIDPSVDRNRAEVNARVIVRAVNGLAADVWAQEGGDR